MESTYHLYIIKVNDILAMMMSVAVVGCGGSNSGANSDASNNTTTNTQTNTNTNKDYTVGAGADSGKDETEEPLTQVIDTRDYDNSTDELINFGTHIYTSPEIADKWLVKDGATEYKLVVPADTIEATKTSFINFKQEFLKWFKEATNINIELVIDDALPVKEHQAGQKYISLDETTLFESLKGTENEIDNSRAKLQGTGGTIVTVDDNIYLVGFSDQGTLNAVYTFLMLTFNFETYSANTTVIDRNVKNLKLRDYAVVDIPDIDYNATSSYERTSFSLGGDYGYSYIHPTEGGYYYGTRNRVYGDDDMRVFEIFEGDLYEMHNNVAAKSALSRPSGHNSVKVVNYTEWKESHPEWFAQNGVQLCYTAGGDEESFELMTDYVTKAVALTMMEYPVDQYPNKRSVDITTSDDMNMCQCDNCVALRPTYKDSGLVVRFFNRVSQKLEEWMKTPEAQPYAREDMEVRFYAYYACETPPAKIDPETGEWAPVDETVIMEKHTCVKYAPIAADFQQSLFASDNKWVKDNFDGWKSLAGRQIGYFMYNYNCTKHNYFYDAFDWYNTKGMNYHFAGGNSYYYCENIHGATPTEWGALTSFVAAKLAYNSLLDSGKLTKDWFRAVFGPASGVMENMLNEIREFTHVETVRNDMYRRRSNRNQVWYAFDWRPNVMLSWIEKTDQATRLIEPLLKSNPEEYDRIKYNIELEVFSPIFILYDQGISLTTEQHNSFISRLENNIVKYPEYQYINPVGFTTIKNWIDMYK